MKVVISGFYGLGNTGDEAILEAILDNLRNEIDEVDITVFPFPRRKRQNATMSGPCTAGGAVKINKKYKL